MKPTVRQQVETKFSGYEAERRQRVREEQRRKDREWAVWVDTADATFEVLRNIGLATPPSQRPPPTGAELLEIMIRERKDKK